MASAEYTVHFPPDYAAEEEIWAAKGYVVVEIAVKGPPPARYSLTLYHPIRLAQDIETELADTGAMFAEPNVVVIGTIDRESVERAIANLARRGFRGLVAQ